MQFESAEKTAETLVKEAEKVAEVPSFEPVPTLELAAKEPEPPAPEAGPDYSMLTEAEQKIVHDFAQKIDITNPNLSLEYGAGAQKNVADFSDAALAAVRTKDLGEVGEMIGSLVVELKGFNAEEDKKGFLGLFKKAGTGIETLKARYNKAEVNVNKISHELEEHQRTLMKDVVVLDQMYDKNLDYYKQLTMYILAGKEKLAQERVTTLVELRNKAEQTGLAEDAQRANDYDAMCLRFEKKLHDLELTRMVSIQMGPQIRLLQNNDTLMSEKIQSSLVNTIPLWKSQMVLALGLSHSQQAMEAQKAVTDMTNELLKKNADKLKMATIETAKESERAIVDIETLQHTNEQLITTLDEVLQIQTEGRQKRAAAEAELRKIEGQLKQKLLETRDTSRG
ncbi:MAG: toxic anion resistance protein [Oscillospiraceae bacterium]|nr:toxic anion resistance protein [Oscillospiraceae bacterium]MBR4193281.1 toxic anion resistance protein [Oscillospiraceae bacterium]